MKKLLFVLLTIVSVLHAQKEDAQPDAKQIAAMQHAMKTIAELEYKTGEIQLIGGKAKIKLGEDFRYLDPANARKVLVDIWSNPPEAGSTLGMIVPKGVNFLDNDTWVAVLEWKPDGYVKDEEFSSIDFNKMLADLKEANKSENAERMKGGYGRLELSGWAEPPHYDRNTHKLYWAKSFDRDGPVQQLNYDIRVLGREGVLEVSIMSSMPQFNDIKAKSSGILAVVDFTEGNRYADYKSGDKVATYGIAGLIAGGVLLKSGFFKVLLTALIAAKKFVVIGVVAIGAWIKKLLGGRKQA
jgi:uncharacterized membrane-anchored protein